MDSATYLKRIKARVMTDEQREAARSWVQLLVNVGATIAMMIAGWGFHQTLQLRSDMDTIKASHLSAADILEIWQSIANLRQDVAGMPDHATIEKIENRQREINDRLIRIESAVVPKH